MYDAQRQRYVWMYEYEADVNQSSEDFDDFDDFDRGMSNAKNDGHDSPLPSVRALPSFLPQHRRTALSSTDDASKDCDCHESEHVVLLLPLRGKHVRPAAWQRLVQLPGSSIQHPSSIIHRTSSITAASAIAIITAHRFQQSRRSQSPATINTTTTLLPPPSLPPASPAASGRFDDMGILKAAGNLVSIALFAIVCFPMLLIITCPPVGYVVGICVYLPLACIAFVLSPLVATGAILLVWAAFVLTVVSAVLQGLTSIIKGLALAITHRTSTQYPRHPRTYPDRALFEDTEENRRHSTIDGLGTEVLAPDGSLGYLSLSSFLPDHPTTLIGGNGDGSSVGSLSPSSVPPRRGSSSASQSQESLSGSIWHLSVSTPTSIVSTQQNAPKSMSFEDGIRPVSVTARRDSTAALAQSHSRTSMVHGSSRVRSTHRRASSSLGSVEDLQSRFGTLAHEAASFSSSVGSSVPGPGASPHSVRARQLFDEQSAEEENDRDNA